MTQDPAGGRDWRSSLFDRYVSSGQSPVPSTDPEGAFATRLPWLRSVIRHHLPDDPDVPILDLGCGHGAFLYALGKAGYRNAHGVDISGEQVEAATRLGIEGVQLGDAIEHTRSLKAESIGVVVTIDLLEHLAGDRLVALSGEIRRIIRPDGRWIVHVPNAEGLFGAGIRHGDLTHRRAFTASSLRQLCRAVGFSRVEVRPDPPRVHGPASLLRRLLWSTGSLPVWLLFAAETGRLKPILTRNLLAVVRP